MFKPTEETRSFQEGINQNVRRRQRESQRLQLRKQTREQLLKKRRLSSNNNNNNNNNNNGNNNFNNGRNYAPGGDNDDDDMSDIKDNPNDENTRKMLKNLDTLVQGCMLDNQAKTNFKCCQRIRRLLSMARQPPIQQVIKSGVVPRLMQFVRQTEYDKLQFEALWALTNIASGKAEHTAVVIKNQAIPIFIEVMENTKNKNVFEQAIWALGNISGDSPECRNLVLKAGGLSKLLPRLKEYRSMSSNQERSILRNATWTLSNFCRGQPQPPIRVIEPAIPILTQLLSLGDQEVMQDASWAFGYLSDGPHIPKNANNQQILNIKKQEEYKLNLIMNSGSIPKLINLLGHRSTNVQHPALRCLGNLISCDDNSIVQRIINTGDLIQKLASLLQSDKKSLKRETCWMLSNITASVTQEQNNNNQTIKTNTFIDVLMDENIFHLLIAMLGNTKSQNRELESFDIRKEAGWTLCNAIQTGNDNQIRMLVNLGCVPALVRLLENNQNQGCIMVTLEGIENMLLFGQRDAHKKNSRNKPAQFVEECGGLNVMEKLQTFTHFNDRIIKKCQTIIKKFFNGKEEYISFDDNNLFNDDNTDDNWNNNNNNNNNAPNQDMWNNVVSNRNTSNNRNNNNNTRNNNTNNTKMDMDYDF